jgi:hypothetical protein
VEIAVAVDAEVAVATVSNVREKTTAAVLVNA